MKSIILQILYAFKRDALFIGTTIFLILCSCFSAFLGSNAVVEANEAKIVYTAGISRVVVVIGFVIFVSFYIKRMFENHEIEVILSHSISRVKVLLSLFVGFALTLIFLLLPLFLILLILKANFINTLIWFISVYFEGIIMLSFTLCCSLIIKSFVHALTSCFLMYLIGRIIGNFIAYISLSFQLNLYSIGCSLLKALSLFIPRLDLFGKTSWLLYGDWSLSTFGIFILQMIVFCGIFLSIAVFDLKRKEF